MDTILIVEDDVAVRNNTEIFLKSEGYTVLTAENGLEALKIIEKTVPDLIVSDIVMPYVDGIELYKKVENEYGYNFLPFIFLSAKSDLPSIREGLNLGADDYITKPFEFSDLSISLKNRLSKKKYYNSLIEDLKNTITKNIPYELRTPLSTILSYSGYIGSEIKNLSLDEIEAGVTAINKAGKRLYHRIEKFLFYESIETDIYSKLFNNYASDTYYISSTDLLNKLNGVLNEYERTGDIEIDAENACLCITEEHFSFMMIELLDNALKFSSKGSPVSIKGKTNGNKYTITVLDNGRGMSPEEISLISAYKQFNKNLLQQTGLGLGLHLIKRTVDLHKGEMQIESNPGEMTRVEIILNKKN